jgi:hypothetical protein
VFTVKQLYFLSRALGEGHMKIVFSSSLLRFPGAILFLKPEHTAE